MEIPFDNIVRFGQQTMIDQPLFSISWILDRFCNYNCSYCWPHAKSNSANYQPLAVYLRAIDQIKLQARQNGFTKFHWSFSGGEPTAYRHLPQLIKYIGKDMLSNYQSIHMTTNLSPSQKWWTKWCFDTQDFERRSITASFHHEFADEKKFVDKCLQLMDKNIFVTVNQVMSPTVFWELYERCVRLSAHGINVTLKPQSNSTASFIINEYDHDMIKIMRDKFPQKFNQEKIFQIILFDENNKKYYFDQAERFNAYGFNKFEGWVCNSGFQSIIIRSNEVKRAYSCHDHPLGTLSEGFRLFDKPYKCITPSCVSSADSKIPKKKK